jgi:hypothetical protein
VLRLAVAASLYAFLIGLFVVIWRDLKIAAAESAARGRTYGRLVVIAADGTGLPEGTAFPLQPITSLGRAPTNTVTIPDGYASGEHALLSLRGNQWWLEDLGSRNGTLLNGNPIGEPVVTSGGDIVGIGRVQLKVELA